MNLLPVFGALVGVAVFADERLGGYVLVALAWSRRGLGFRNRAPCVWHSGGGRNRMRAFS